MATKLSSVKIPDSQLAVEMLKRKLVNESQLKAAIDYQESLGGRLLDILLKLGLVRKEAVDQFLRQLLSDEASGDHTAAGAGLHVDPEKLMVHRKLLEKVPKSVVKEIGLLFFFPPPGTRAILMSTEMPPTDEMKRNLQNLLGVELYPIEIESEVRARFLPESAAADARKAVEVSTGAENSRSKESPIDEVAEDGDTDEPTGSAAEDDASSASEGAEVALEEGDSHPVLKALVNLLDSKQIISKDELRVEVELLRRRKND